MNIPDFNKRNNSNFTEKYIKKHFYDFYIFLTNKYDSDLSWQEKVYLYFNNLTEPPVCRTCGGKVRFTSYAHGYTQYCGLSCMGKNVDVQAAKLKTKLKNFGDIHSIVEKAKNTMLRKYGDKNYNNRKKYKVTCIERYGVDNVMHSNDILTKRLEHFNTKYNSNSPFGSTDVQAKSKQTKQLRYNDKYYNNREKYKDTCLSRYGVDNPNKLDNILQKTKQTNLIKYGDEWQISTTATKLKSQQTMIDRYGVPYYVLTDEIKKSYGNNSDINKLFASKLENNNIDYIREYRIGNFVYDFKINNILIEINPTITHNSTWGIHNNPKDRDYHINKTKTAESNNFRCIHVWDWDDIDKIINILKEKSVIYARKCIVREIDKKECDVFLETNHLQGTCKGQQIRLGLYYNDELVEVITFGKPRYNKNYEYELLRLCTNMNYIIIGGSEKLFAYFNKNYKPKSIISYCDRSKFNGDIYDKLGFKLKYTSQPACHWYNIKTKQHITDNLLRQKGFDKLFKTDYGKGTVNEELMIDNGFVRVYDSGQKTYVIL